jgi:hypothetical protein
VLFEQGGSFVDPGATATDAEDGNLTGSIVIGGDIVDTNTIGTYIITYNVMDSDLNPAVQKTRTVNVTATSSVDNILTKNARFGSGLIKGYLGNNKL